MDKVIAQDDTSVDRLLAFLESPAAMSTSAMDVEEGSHHEATDVAQDMIRALFGENARLQRLRLRLLAARFLAVCFIADIFRSAKN